MIRLLLALLLLTPAAAAAAQECHVPRINPLDHDDACLCFRDGSILDTESCRMRTTLQGVGTACPNGICVEGSAPSIQGGPSACEAKIAAPTLDEALAACERHRSEVCHDGWCEKTDDYASGFIKCSRIRAMHDDAQSKRDLDTIDRFLDGQK